MYKRALQVVLIVFVAFTMLGATSPSARFTRLGHDLMCTCGCSEILLECNHVGCPNSTGEIADLHAQIDSGASDAAIFKFFSAKYGPTVLAEPVRGGFDIVAWIGPFAFLLIGILLILFVVRIWKARHARMAPALPDLPTQEAEALRLRIRNETKYGE
ncbi:MAG: cytochrome c-type biogenesis protein CcmH [Acidobacteriaceae bacterium]